MSKYSYVQADHSKPYAEITTKKSVTVLGTVMPAGSHFELNLDSREWDRSYVGDKSFFENEELFTLNKVTPARNTSEVETVEVKEEPQTEESSDSSADQDSEVVEGQVVDFEPVEAKPTAPKRRTTRK